MNISIYNVEHRLRIAFYQLGLFIAERPITVIGVILTMTTCSSFGWLYFEEQNDIRNDFSADNSPSRREFSVQQEFHLTHGSPFYLMVTVRAQDEKSLLRSDHLKALNPVTKMLNGGVSVMVDGRSYSYDDLCDAYCLGNTGAELLTENWSSATSSNNPNIKLTYPTMSYFGESIYLANTFLGVAVDNSTGALMNAKLLILHYRATITNSSMNYILTEWENAMFEYIDTFADSKLLHISAVNDRLVSTEVRRTGMTAVPYFTLSFSVILIFTRITCPQAHHIVIIIGVLCPLLSLVTSFGVLLAIGVGSQINFCLVQVTYVPLVAVSPFLILAIGVDDVYIMLHTYARIHSDEEKDGVSSTKTVESDKASVESRHNIPDALNGIDKMENLKVRFATTLQDAGPSITVTSATNALSFAIGIFSPTLAIRTFCLYSTVAIVTGYIYQLLFFSAVVYAVAEVEERSQDRPGTCKEDSELKYSALYYLNAAKLQKCVSSAYTKWLVKWVKICLDLQSRLFVFTLTIIYWIMCMYGILNMNIELSVEKLFLADSPLHDFIHVQDEYLFKDGGQLQVIVGNPGDLRRSSARHSARSLVSRFEDQSEIIPGSTLNWLPAFMHYSELEFDNTMSGFTGETVEFDYRRLLNFTTAHSEWSHYVTLNEDDCMVNTPTCLDSYMFVVGFSNATEWPWRLNLLKGWRSIVDDYPDLNATIYEEFSMYADQIDSIGPVTLTTVLVALLCMTLVCCVFIPNISSILCATASVCSIVTGVIGCLSLWNVDLDPMSTATILMSIGFSVDFTAHISYHYYLGGKVGVDKHTRLHDALSGIAWPMIQAAVSTCMSVTVLCIVDSYMILVFVKTVCLTMMFGLIHGLIMLPMLLSALSEINCSINQNKNFEITEKEDAMKQERERQIESKSYSQNIEHDVETLPEKTKPPPSPTFSVVNLSESV